MEMVFRFFQQFCISDEVLHYALKLSATTTLVVCGIYGIYKLISILGPDDEYFERIQFNHNHIHIERRILILGLDGSGKSSFVHCFRKRSKNAPLVIHEEDVKASMNVKKIDMGNTSFYFIDLAGSADIRPFWEQVILVNRPDVIVWLIDSADEIKFGESRAALHHFLGNDVTVGIPLLVVANKQDKKEALPPWALKEKLSLDQIGQNRKVEVIATQIPCGQTPSCERRGIFKAYKSMASM